MMNINMNKINEFKRSLGWKIELFFRQQRIGTRLENLQYDKYNMFSKPDSI